MKEEGKKEKISREEDRPVKKTIWSNERNRSSLRINEVTISQSKMIPKKT